MNEINLMGVKINAITMDQTIEKVIQWSREKPKRMIFTPNIEFLMLAQKDSHFKEILNKSDLSIPDSSRFGWTTKVLRANNLLKRVLIWLTFMAPKLFLADSFPVVTGTDLMEKLVKLSSDKAFRIGLIGGKKNLAEKLAERLKKDNPKLKVTFADSSIKVDSKGNTISWSKNPKELRSDIMILFVALGHRKQEGWITKNKDIFPAKIFVGVGGAFDYLSGDVLRAPLWMRRLGIEWLFRLIIQPWRIKRFGELVKYVFLVLSSKKTNDSSNISELSSAET